MMKQRHVIILYSLTFCASYAMENPDAIVNCAKASRYAYKNTYRPVAPEDFNTSSTRSLFDGFHCIYKKDVGTTGFQGVTFFNPEKRTLITAFRGTDESLEANIQEDLGILNITAQTQKCSAADIIKRQYDFVDRYYYKDAPVLAYAGRTIFSWVAPWILKGFAYEEGCANKQHTKAQLLALILTAHAYYKQSLETHKTITNLAQPQYNYVTGHSLGGFLAQLVCAHDETDKRAIGYTYNAPGALDLARTHSLFERELEEVPLYNYVRSHDIVGTLGTHIGHKHECADISLDPYSTYNPFNLAQYCENNHRISMFADDLRDHYKP